MMTEANRLPAEEITNTATSVTAVEELLKYRFKNTKLLEEALTHTSCNSSSASNNYQRLAFVGDAALGLAISSYFFSVYPDVDCGKLTDLRAANVSTEKLARVAVRHGLYNYLRRNSPILDEKVKEFVITVQQEAEMEFYGGVMKAPKILADIVESVMGAVYVDCGFDVNAFWLDGKQVEVEHRKEGDKNIASVYVDGQFIASASSEHKENAKLQVAKAALKELFYDPYDEMDVEFVPSQKKKTNVEFAPFQKIKMDVEFDPTKESEEAKQRLNELCGRKKWSKPSYRIEKEIGPAHNRSFTCSVQVSIGENMFSVMGDEKSRVKDAENSAALAMIQGLQESKVS
ncbi:ribonuclease 3-like protein 2 isoform X2 [Nicotiana sylvestris]|uniref:Ribonuclease 3-like protein 2 isoform X2 n=1 Tax=Nicotiana sylvestris TaxID=4096 RepID=A0A1U7V6C1_NICSY|nr:PREDICTED: ribonuclease 3-like protein 2 isoform X2 [Nicotiana sylvestris]